MPGGLPGGGGGGGRMGSSGIDWYLPQTKTDTNKINYYRLISSEVIQRASGQDKVSALRRCASSMKRSLPKKTTFHRGDS